MDRDDTIAGCVGCFIVVVILCVAPFVLVAICWAWIFAYRLLFTGVQ